MRPIERLLLLLGGFAVMWVGGVYLFSWVDHARQNQMLENMRVERAAPRSGDIHLPAVPAVSLTVARERPVAARAARTEGTMLGRVEVPRLGLSAIVREGVEAGTLRRAVGHVPETALPGEHGNMALAAHRDTHFKPLQHIRKGDRIKVVTPDGEHEYRVAGTRIVTPEDVSVLDPTPRPTLTLITCYPFNYVGSAPKRFIVRAEAVQPAPVATAGLTAERPVAAPPAPPMQLAASASPAQQVVRRLQARSARRAAPAKIKSKSSSKRASLSKPARSGRTVAAAKQKPKSGWKKFIGVFKPKARPRTAR